MQQHRDGERHRHRGLNASIEEICKHVPGYDENGYYTKIGKLTIVTSYICHLEEYIQELCEEVGLDLDFKNLFLSPHIKELDNCETHCVTHTNLTSDVSNKIPESESDCCKRYATSPASDTWLSHKVLNGQNLQQAAVSPADNSSTSSNYVFPGTGSYDPFGVCSGSDTELFHGANKGQSVPQTPSNKDWLNSNNESDHFLSPEIFNFLQSNGYNVEALDLSSPLFKGEKGCLTESSPCHSKYEEIVPDDAIPVLFDTEVITEVSCTSYNDLAEHKDSDTDTADVKSSLEHSVAAEHPDRIHVVPHLEGMDLSEEEEENKHSVLLSDKLEAFSSQTAVQSYKLDAGMDAEGADVSARVGNEEKTDDMFVSHLQQIEEDENDYTLSEKPCHLAADMLDATEELVQQHASDQVSLLTPSQLLLDAGLSPQYIKAGFGNIVYSPAFSLPDFKRGGTNLLTTHDSPEKVEPPLTSVPKEFTSRMSTEDSSLDSTLGLTCSPQNNVYSAAPISRNSTPVDSDYDSLAAEPLCISTNKDVVDQSLEDTRGPCSGVLGNMEEKFEKDKCCINGITSDRDSCVRPHIDYRKVSWMNGFMMYSCLNRSKISEKNPGLHASQVTKLLGQEWRRMSADQQDPYRKQASQYVKEVLAKTFSTEQ